jgi:hypothetical protein
MIVIHDDKEHTMTTDSGKMINDANMLHSKEIEISTAYDASSGNFDDSYTISDSSMLPYLSHGCPTSLGAF